MSDEPTKTLYLLTPDERERLRRIHQRQAALRTAIQGEPVSDAYYDINFLLNIVDRVQLFRESR